MLFYLFMNKKIAKTLYNCKIIFSLLFREKKLCRELSIKKQNKSIKDQRNFCSNTFFKVFANSVNNLRYDVCTSVTSRIIYFYSLPWMAIFLKLMNWWIWMNLYFLYLRPTMTVDKTHIFIAKLLKRFIPPSLSLLSPVCQGILAYFCLCIILARCY